MITVRFSRHLVRHFSIPPTCDGAGKTVSELLADLNRRYPGLTEYILHENGTVRQHVNIFVGERLLADRQRLSDSLEDVDEVSIMQALSGG